MVYFGKSEIFVVKVLVVCGKVNGFNGFYGFWVGELDLIWRKFVSVL